METSPTKKNKSSTSKGKVLFDKSTKSGGENQEDIWDDRALIRAYERSIKQVKEKLTGVTASTSKTAAATSEAYRDGDESDEEEEYEEEEEEEEDDDEEYVEYKTEGLEKKADPKQWKVGDLCMAIYSEDNLVYPANIINIDGDKCTVRYLHYLNEEEKNLNELYEKVGGEEEEEKASNENKKEETKIEEKISRAPLNFLPPPPPMPLPDLDSKVSEDDALHSMLISWYMSGYHTGFYFGLKSAQKSIKK